MTNEFKIAIDGLVAAREALYSKISNWSEDQLSFKPAPDSWSAKQVLQHILLSETGTFGYVLKKTSSGWEGLTKVGEEEKSNGDRLVAKLSTTDKIKAPAVLPEPNGEESLESIKERWEELRKNMIPFFENMDEAFYDRLVFKQPAAGPITPWATVVFLTKHIEHHFMQIDEIAVAMK